MTSRGERHPIAKVLMKKGALDLLKRVAKQEYPREACGILVTRMTDSIKEKTPVVNEIRPVTNHADETVSGWHFQVDPMEMCHLELQLEKEGKQLVGFYHSHPDAPAELSAEDEKFFVPGMVYVIMAVDGGQAGEIRAYFRALPDEAIKEIEINLEVEV